MNKLRVTIDPQVFIWGAKLKQTITTIADVAGALHKKYFLLQTRAGGKFAPWIKIADGAAGDPEVPAGYTKVEVAVAEGATAATIATALQTAIHALSGISATVDGSVVTAIDASRGIVDPAEDPAVGGTGFAFAVIKRGIGGQLGYTDGDMEVTPSIETKEINAHQLGNIPVAELITKIGIEGFSLTLKEVDAEQLENIFSAVGTTQIPDGGTSKITGLGTAKIGQSISEYAEPAFLHPIDADDDEYDGDTCMPCAVPIPGTLKFSGTDEKTATVEFRTFPHSDLPTWCNIIMWGDHSQVLTD